MSKTPLDRDELPKGAYFYHSTPRNRLNSIKKLGLTTPEVHKKEKRFTSLSEYPKEANDRLFVWATEHECLAYVRYNHKREDLVALRFERYQLSKVTLYVDAAYTENTSVFAKPICFFINETVPAKSLEYSTISDIKMDNKRGKFFSQEWRPLIVEK